MRSLSAILLFSVLGAPAARAATFAAVSPVEPALFAEMLSRVEMMNQMGFGADIILNNVETQISARARDVIMAYGASAELAVREFLIVELARRRAESDRADLRRTQRAFADCLNDDRRFDEYRIAVEAFVSVPRGRFDAVTAVAELPIETRGVRECLRILPDLYAAATRAGEPALAKAYWCVGSETRLALRMRDVELAGHPVRRTFGRTRDAALGAYYRLKERFLN